MSDVTTAKQAMEVISGTGLEISQQHTYLGELEEKLEELQTTADSIRSTLQGTYGNQGLVKKYFENLAGVMTTHELPHDREDAIIEAIDPLAEKTASISEILHTFIESVKAAEEILFSSMEVCESASTEAGEVAGQITAIIA